MVLPFAPLPLCAEIQLKWNNKKQTFHVRSCVYGISFLSSLASPFARHQLALFYFRITILTRCTRNALLCGVYILHTAHNKSQRRRPKATMTKGRAMPEKKNAHGNYDRHFSLLSLFFRTSFLFPKHNLSTSRSIPYISSNIRSHAVLAFILTSLLQVCFDIRRRHFLLFELYTTTCRFCCCSLPFQKCSRKQIK